MEPRADRRAAAITPAACTPVDWKTQSSNSISACAIWTRQALASAVRRRFRTRRRRDLSDDEVLQRVREMLGQSETRQQRALAARLTEVTRDFDAQRQLDLVAIDQGMARLQNTSGAEVRQWRDLASA